MEKQMKRTLKEIMESLVVSGKNHILMWEENVIFDEEKSAHEIMQEICIEKGLGEDDFNLYIYRHGGQIEIFLN